MQKRGQTSLSLVFGIWLILLSVHALENSCTCIQICFYSHLKKCKLELNLHVCLDTVVLIPVASLLKEGREGKKRLNRIHAVSSFCISTVPVLLSFQQFPVGSDLDIQSQLHIHQFLVLADLHSHVLLGSLESFLQLSDAVLAVCHRQLTALLSLCDLSLQVIFLKYAFESGEIQTQALKEMSEKSNGETCRSHLGFNHVDFRLQPHDPAVHVGDFSLG